ncbi:hypothetical protein Acr_12g0003120 [Actinidia rufa]|uniref:Uncharacterized protein n=1 Tax=Actinidia rufa TaxID=165716 RepID=A0A7J0FGG3_9ERIC|nr:hypothetical protein Acr_12g0003120 [Actinidia rufa]
MLAVEALMQKEGLEFTADDLLHVYYVVKPRKNPETQMLEGNHYLRLRKPIQPQTRLVTDSPNKDQYLNDFIWVSGQWEFPAGEPNPFSVPRHRGYVPVGFNSRFWRRSDRCLAAISTGRPILPPLQIRGQGPRSRSSLSNEVSNLFEGISAKLRRLLEEAEGKSSDSSESSFSIWDVDLGDEDLDKEAEVEDGEEVDQVPTAAPLVPIPLVQFSSSDSNIAVVEPREIVEHSYSRSGSSSFGSRGNEETMAPKVRILGKGQAPRTEPTKLPETPQFIAMELGKHVTSTDTSKDHETCIALGNAMMLPHYVADHATKTTAEFGGKLVMLGAQRAVSTSFRLKQGAVDLKKANQKANSLEKELKQLAKLRPGIFQEGWLACLKELKTPPDHPAWASPALPIQLPTSLERYSQIILPDFNKEEYATLPADEGNVNAAVVEARAGIEGTVDGDRAGEIEGDRARSQGTIFLESLHNADSSSARFISTLHIPTRAVVCSRQMSLSSSLLRLQFLEDLYKFWGIKMLVVHKIRILDLAPSAFAEYRSLLGTLPYLEATIHKAAPLLAVLDDRSVVPLSFRMED